MNKKNLEKDEVIIKRSYEYHILSWKYRKIDHSKKFIIGEQRDAHNNLIEINRLQNEIHIINDKLNFLR